MENYIMQSINWARDPIKSWWIWDLNMAGWSSPGWLSQGHEFDPQAWGCVCAKLKSPRSLWIWSLTWMPCQTKEQSPYKYQLSGFPEDVLANSVHRSPSCLWKPLPLGKLLHGASCCFFVCEELTVLPGWPQEPTASEFCFVHIPWVALEDFSHLFVHLLPMML